MNTKIIEHKDRRVHIVRLDADESIVGTLGDVVRGAGIRSGVLRGRGRLSRLTLMQAPAGDETTVPCPADVLMLDGDVVLEGSEPSVVVQVMVVLSDGTVAAGRVAEAVAESCEILIEEAAWLPPRRLDPDVGAAFVDFTAGEPAIAGSDGESGRVDEAGDESFPASDPPSFAGVPGD